MAVPKPTYQPFNRLYGRHQAESAAGQAQEGLDLTIELFVLGGRKLGSILILAVLRKDGRLEAKEADIELAEFLKTRVACVVEGLVVLSSSNLRLPDQRLCVCSLLGLDV